jgi:hypothetical protein
VRSSAHDVENGHNPDAERAAAVAGWLAVQGTAQPTPGSVAGRARDLCVAGFKSWDALHVAWAEFLGADVFVTTDDRLLSLCRANAATMGVRVSDPVAFARECC